MSTESANTKSIDKIFSMIEVDRKAKGEANTEVRVELAELSLKIDNLQRDHQSETTMNQTVLDEIKALKEAPTKAAAKGSATELLKDWRIIVGFLAVVLGGPEGIDAVKSQFFPGKQTPQPKIEYVQPPHVHGGTGHTHSGDRVPKLEGY